MWPSWASIVRRRLSTWRRSRTSRQCSSRRKSGSSNSWGSFRSQKGRFPRMKFNCIRTSTNSSSPCFNNRGSKPLISNRNSSKIHRSITEASSISQSSIKWTSRLTRTRKKTKLNNFIPEGYSMPPWLRTSSSPRSTRRRRRNFRNLLTPRHLSSRMITK